MTANDKPSRTRRVGRVVLALVLFMGLVGAILYQFRHELGDEWQIRNIRRAAASDDADLPQYQQRFIGQLTSADDTRLDIAVRLADDPDPKVRLAALDILFANQPRAKRLDEPGPPNANRGGSWRTRVREAVSRLLKDENDAARKKAIRMARELDWTDMFGSELTEIVRSGPTDERVLVAETLAHWNGPLLRDVVNDPGQPDEVRIAAMRGLDAYGDKASAAWRDQLRDAFRNVLQSGGPELRRTAVLALRHAEGGATVWLDLLCAEHYKDLHPLVLQTWIDALGSESALYRHWSDSHEAWYRSTPSSPRTVIAGFVLCEGARLQIAHLERAAVVIEAAAMLDRQGPTGRAFDTQIARLGNVLSVVSAVRWYCAVLEKAPEFEQWLPHETPAGATPVRDPRAYLFRLSKPLWEWCLARKDAYPSRFLAADSIVRNYGRKDTPLPVPLRPLGEVMDEIFIDRAEFERLRTRYAPKARVPSSRRSKFRAEGRRRLERLLHRDES